MTRRNCRSDSLNSEGRGLRTNAGGIPEGPGSLGFSCVDCGPTIVIFFGRVCPSAAFLETNARGFAGAPLPLDLSSRQTHDANVIISDGSHCFGGLNGLRRRACPDPSTRHTGPRAFDPKCTRIALAQLRTLGQTCDCGSVGHSPGPLYRRGNMRRACACLSHVRATRPGAVGSIPAEGARMCCGEVPSRMWVKWAGSPPPPPPLWRMGVGCGLFSPLSPNCFAHPCPPPPPQGKY